MVIWISTAILALVIAAIVRTEVRCSRKAKAKQHDINGQINALAKTTFDRHRDIFGRDPTGTFPIFDATTGEAKK